MRITIIGTVLLSLPSANIARGQSNPPADCSGLGGSALFSLKAVAVNGVPVTPANSVTVAPGDSIDAEIFVSCWGTVLDDVRSFAGSIFMRDGATSGTSGLILPRGWDAPVVADPCPCDDPQYPNCVFNYGCVGPQHNAELGAELDTLHPDFLLAGFGTVTAVDVSSLFHFRFGGAVDGPLGTGAADAGQVGYIGTLHLVVQDDACGSFSFQFELAPTGGPTYPCYQSFLCDSQFQIECICPVIEPLTIHVCEDDGLFCNGVETCDAQAGCQISSPPNCNDGVVCTVDSCDEAAMGCAHALNHAACDDGDVCTRDECTPSGCVNIDDLCGDIPAASIWGLAVFALSLLIAAKLRFRRRLA